MNYYKLTVPITTMNINTPLSGQQGDSVGKGICHQAQWPGFQPCGYVVAGENWFPQVFLWILHGCCGMSLCPQKEESVAFLKIRIFGLESWLPVKVTAFAEDLVCFPGPCQAVPNLLSDQDILCPLWVFMDTWTHEALSRAFTHIKIIKRNLQRRS